MSWCVSDEPGCKNGKPWIKDPRCHPYCRGTVMKKTFNNNTNMFILIVLAILLLGIIIIALIRSDVYNYNWMDEQGFATQEQPSIY